MSGIARPARRSAIVDELFVRQPALAAFGMVLLVASAVMLGAQAFDHRTIGDVSVWAKPAKFAFSIAVFVCTNAWFFGYVRPDRRRSRSLRRTAAVMMLAGGFELAYITWQGAHGLASHFNRSSPFYEIMYALMGVGALALIGTTLPLAWEIARRPASGFDPAYLAAVVLGLVLCFVLGTGTGGYMAQGTGHSVGVVGGQVPIFGWNRSGGDLRVAHLLGVHAQQAIPILGALLTSVRQRFRMTALALGSTAYLAITMLTLAQAVAGKPLIPLFS